MAAAAHAWVQPPRRWSMSERVLADFDDDAEIEGFVVIEAPCQIDVGVDGCGLGRCTDEEFGGPEAIPARCRDGVLGAVVLGAEPVLGDDVAAQDR